MLAKLFSSKPILDEASAQWLHEVFAWALVNFDAQFFYQKTQLIKPSNEFFPGRETSAQGMAQLIFDKVSEYSGMSHWPLRLQQQQECQVGEPPQLHLNGVLRAEKGSVAVADNTDFLPVPYDPGMVGNPEGMIAGFAHTFAQVLGQTAKQEPPGGAENWPQTTEVLAIFMGFGLMFANSAFIFNTNKCGSCSTQAKNRNNYLSQYDATYALAIFCVLKDIPAKKVLPELKKSLRGFYKKAVREIAAKQVAVS